MPISSKRKWKTVELDDALLAEFADMGGIEIDVLSDDAYPIKTVKMPGDSNTNDKPVEKKKKKKANKTKVTKAASKPVVEVAEETSIAVDGEAPVETPEIIVQSADLSEWKQFGTALDDRLLGGVGNLGFTRPTAIQSAVFDKAIEGWDILAAAETGSGKTLGFGLPILQSILKQKDADPEPATRCLCILPTRELALQVKKHLQAVAVSAITIGEALGGMSLEKQFRVLSRKPDIIVGTPGRLAGLLGLGKKTPESGTQTCKDLKDHLCDKLSFLVIDEADRLLEQAHFRDLTSILRFVYTSIPSVDSLQSFIFSATLPVEGSELGRLLKRLRLKPESHRLTVDLGAAKAEAVSVPQSLEFRTIYSANEDDREAYLVYFLLRKLVSEPHQQSKAIVFVNAISYVYRLASVLPVCLPKSANALVVGMHSNLRQKDRLKKLDQFVVWKGPAVMVATDLAARGLDLPHVSSVVHLQPPRTPESLIHRSGRTARAGRSGECIMIVTPKMATQWTKTVRQGLSKDLCSIESIEPVSIDINQVRQIHQAASRLEGVSHKHKRDTKNQVWSKKTCDQAELWDSDLTEGGEDSDALIFGDEHLRVGKGKKGGQKNRNGQQGNIEQTHLEQLLMNPIPSMKNL
jgi:ATP-dependent RNA helicase DDX24/MAK5